MALQHLSRALELEQPEGVHTGDTVSEPEEATSTMSRRDSELPPLDENLRRSIIEKTAQTIEDHYIFPDDADRMAALLLSRQQGKAFDEAGTIPELTKKLTEAVQSVRQDLHLAVMPWVAPSGGEDNDESGMMDALRRRWRRHNYEFRKLEILLGNVGYLDLRGFPTAAVAGPTTAAAMQFLSHADALIFDVRDNGGGEDLVYLLMSYLFDEPKHVHTARHRDHDEQVWTYGFVPGPRFPNHPAYVLISRSTFSAGEDFSYNLQQQGRVVVVGEQTCGGAHPVEFYRFPELFLELMIPNAYSISPISGTNWEESGVVPDIEVPADDALAVAHEQAMVKLVERAEDDELRRYRTWALDTLRGRKTRYDVDVNALMTYVGRYSGSVSVEAQDTTLTLSWGGRRAHRLTPLSEHCFEFDHGTQRVTFAVEDGQVNELVWETEDGDAWTMKRLP